MILNGILKGDYQGLLDVIASEIPRPTFARLKPPTPRICRLRPCSQAAAVGQKRIRRRKSPAGVFGDEELLAKKSEVHKKIC